ncbi:MAG: hypothetical protein ASARMPREDX12_004869 [Alectoria sarmentosa]|nr:MAG: hypothetical protein ASARMPRED_000188 [Alectoria sarmentosa]CAD6572034.1 MAG: hypothetical protein ASARMPREDX12_004869 [Alectoria sarmentosa]
MGSSLPLQPLPLSAGLQERQITSSASDLSYHIIESGSKGNPLIILLHGFPELAYSWRKVMPALAKPGFYVVAFDQRGYGRTTGWDASCFQGVDLRTFAQTNLVRDVIVLVQRLGYNKVECIVGHDFGCVPASLAALSRPDVFRQVVLLGAPFLGPPRLPFDIAPERDLLPAMPDLHEELRRLDPPRKHYRWYYSTAEANKEMAPKEGLFEFLRGYFHLKSADAHNNPRPLKEMTAKELAILPHYYVMPLELGMRDTVAQDMTEEETEQMREKSPRWFPDAELDIYVSEFGRTGFQGGLNWYRVITNPELQRDIDIFAGKKVEVPLLYITGTKDWLIYQHPGSIDKMKEACTDFRGVKWVEDAGHWVQQEKPETVVERILEFLGKQ